MSSKKLRNVISNKVEGIDRIWAEHGMVRVIDSNGKTQSFTPQEAARRAKQINAGLPYGTEAQKSVLKLVETVIQACREAMAQREQPKNKSEAEITKAFIKYQNEAAGLDETPDLAKKIQQFQALCPLLSRYEIKIVLKQGFPEKYAQDMLFTINSDRYQELNEKRQFSEPLSTFDARLK